MKSGIALSTEIGPGLGGACYRATVCADALAASGLRILALLIKNG
jgi:hypothetical protein